MKKIKFLAFAAAMFLAAGNVCAQVDNTFSFIDAAGNEVKDGTTVICYAEKKYNVEDMPFLGYKILAKFDLNVKNNTSATAKVALKVDASLNPVSGKVQVCFPSSCDSHDRGSFTTASGDMMANEVRDLSSEWIFEKGKYAEETVSLTILSGDKKAVGPKVTIRCIYADPTGIAGTEADKNVTETARYDANGRKLGAPQKGLNIVKMSNGETRKVAVE